MKIARTQALGEMLACIIALDGAATAIEVQTLRGVKGDAHIAAAGRKLGAANRVHLVAKAFALGILKAGAALVLLLSMLANGCDDGVVRRVGRIRPRRDEIILCQLLAQICATD